MNNKSTITNSEQTLLFLSLIIFFLCGIFAMGAEGGDEYHQGYIYIKFADGSLNADKKAKLQTEGLHSTGLSSVDYELNRAGLQAIRPAFRTGRLSEKVRARVQRDNKQLPDLSRIAMVSYSSPLDAAVLASKLAIDPAVEYAEPVPVDRPCADPNDPMYKNQYYLPQISCPDAWEVHKGESGSDPVIIGINDTGTEWYHPDLRDNLWQNLAEDADGDGHVIELVKNEDDTEEWVLDPGDLNGVDDDGNGYTDDLIGWDFMVDKDTLGEGPDPMDYYGHGTHVAGLAAAVTNNETGIAAASWNVKFMPTSHSSPDFNYIWRGYEGIVYLAEMGCDIINCSWGGTTESYANAEAIAYATELGAIVIAAAGNDNMAGAFYPSAYPYVISVAAVTNEDDKTSYSNFDVSVDIACPGGDYNAGGAMLSTIPGQGYTSYQGTSMASPLTSSVFALLKSYKPNWSNEKIIRQILGTCDEIYTEKNENYQKLLGFGRVNAYNALTQNAGQLDPTIKLRFDHFDISELEEASNMDGAVQPGETVNIDCAIRHYSHFPISQDITFILSSPESGVVIINDEATASQDGDFFLPAGFSVQFPDDSRSKKYKFELSASSEVECLPAQFSFYVHVSGSGYLVYEPATMPGSSGKYIHDILTAQRYYSLYTNDFPSSLRGYDAVFLSFGCYGELYGTATESGPIKHWMLPVIDEFISSGGKLYMEGNDIMEGIRYNEDYELLHKLGIDSVFDGDAVLAGEMAGQQGSVAESMTFTSNYYRFDTHDELQLRHGAVPALVAEYGVQALQNEPGNDAKVYVSISPISELITAGSDSNNYKLLKNIIEYFGRDFEYMAVDLQAAPTTGHAITDSPFTLNAQAITRTSMENIEYAWDFNGDGQADDIQQTTTTEFSSPGIYPIHLIAKNDRYSTTDDAIIKVFDGNSALNFNASTFFNIPFSEALNLSAAFTIETWVRFDGSFTNYGRLYDQGVHRIQLQNKSIAFIFSTAKNSRAEYRAPKDIFDLDKWQHIALTYDSTYNETHFYLNGAELELTVTKEPDAAMKSVGENSLAIGNRRDYPIRPANVIMDEIKIWNTAKSSAYIAGSRFTVCQGDEEHLAAYYRLQEGSGSQASALDTGGYILNYPVNLYWEQGIRMSQIQQTRQLKSVCPGQTIELTPELLPNNNVQYHWLLNGQAIEASEKYPDPTRDTLVINDITVDEAGLYTIVADNSPFGGEDSKVVYELRVPHDLEINEAPQETLVMDMYNDLLLEVEINSDAPVSYQWYYNDRALPGETNPSLYKRALLDFESGAYKCVVTAPCASVETATELTVKFVSVDEIQVCEDIIISPNPSVGIIKINIPQSVACPRNILIVDMNGRVAGHLDLTDNNYYDNIVQFSPKAFELNSGMYYIIIVSDDQKIAAPFVVVR